MSAPEAEAFEQTYPAPQSSSFFLNWLHDPFAIGAVAPSGRLLAKLMAAGVAPGARVVELGAGTGTVTNAILRAGVAPCDLFVVEQNPRFAALLTRKFPLCEVIVADALSLGKYLGGLSGAVDFVISGLPLLLFSKQQKRRLLEQTFALLAPAGRLHQFTYGGRCSIARGMLAELGLRKSLLGISPLNLPPAFVYKIERDEC
ncbi:MAG TPA: methyltransferase domain-containing protein [Gammaproteobacteria bacterium]|nr:methyltransferase domain-containing protein [Gammaproteobacteria bacterium]